MLLSRICKRRGTFFHFVMGLLHLVSFTDKELKLTHFSKLQIDCIMEANKHKELTNSLVLASDWLSNISVRFGLIKRDSEKKSQYHWQNSSPFTNPCLSL